MCILAENKGNFLYFATIIQSMINYLSKAFENGIIDSLSSHKNSNKLTFSFAR